ncbi:MAG: hypothetical protein M1338_00300 [Patescibacteria group bacterium]|nr:hypothetical protein [Patescibacteria group bacterium]
MAVGKENKDKQRQSRRINRKIKDNKRKASQRKRFIQNLLLLIFLAVVAMATVVLVIYLIWLYFEGTLFRFNQEVLSFYTAPLK